MPDPVDPAPPVAEPLSAEIQLFEQTLYGPMRDANNFCAGCHGGFQVPLFAVEDVTDAYNSLVSQQKVNLVSPANSRVYLRASDDRHNCGGSASCDRVAAEFLAAIELWASQVEQPDPPPATAAISASVSFADAIEVAAPRVEANLLSAFSFEEGAGTVAADSTGTGIALNIEGMEWEPGGGLRNVSGKAEASAADSRKLFDAISASGAYTVEAWVIPDNTTQDGPARMISYSGSTTVRNFTLGQNASYYQLRNRVVGGGENGFPFLEALDPLVETELTHVVATFDPAAGSKIYVNGVLAIEDNTPGMLNWQDDQTFVLGNEVTDDRIWQGVFKLVAIHTAALTDLEVQQNFTAGLGNLTKLRFDLSAALGQPGAIEMIASPIDAKAYLFAKPMYVGDATDVAVKNLRIAVNGTIPIAAQSFRRLDLVVPQSGMELSPLGAIIPSTLGINDDQFRLEFELLGTAVGSTDAIAPAAPQPDRPDTPEPEHGVRSFSQINDTMAGLTAVDPNGNAISSLYQELRGSLPSTNNLEAYSQPQQIAIQRLANGYCEQVTNDNNRCNNFFGSCSIGANGKAAVADTLFDRFVGGDLNNQPMRAEFSTTVVALLDDLSCANGCNGATARTALAAACSAVLASGAVTIH